MRDLRDLSELPADERYWQGLEARIMAELGPRIRGEAGGDGWWAPLAARAWRLGGLAAAAAIAALLLVPPRATPQPPEPTMILRPPRGLPEVEALLASPAPPAVASLLIPQPAEARDDR